MSWLGRWAGRWFGRWFGGVQELRPHALRFGRILNAGDLLFSDSQYPSLVTSGGVFLLRESTDDYARFRVLDTTCPPLPEPSSPLDSGTADVAEPNRWQYAGVYVSATGWKFRAHPTNSEGLDWVQPAYACYGGDFTVDLQFRISISGLLNKGAAADTNWFVFGNYSAGWGVAVGGTIDWVGDIARCRVHAWSGGNPGTGLNTINEGTTYTLRITRSSGTVTVSLVGGNSAQVATGSTGQVQFRLWRDFRTYDPPFIHLPPVTVLGMTTQAGAPASVTVSTPVVDIGSPDTAQPSRYPAIGTLQWRASDTPFLPQDSTPPWDNPEGAYRYWQVRVTWTDFTYLLERIELVSDIVTHIFTIPCIGRNIEVWHATRKLPRGGAKGIVSLPRRAEEDAWETDPQRIVTIDR